MALKINMPHRQDTAQYIRPACSKGGLQRLKFPLEFYFFFELGVPGGLPEVGLSPHAALESVGADLRSPCTDLPHKSRR